MSVKRQNSSTSLMVGAGSSTEEWINAADEDYERRARWRRGPRLDLNFEIIRGFSVYVDDEITQHIASQHAPVDLTSLPKLLQYPWMQSGDSLHR